MIHGESSFWSSKQIAVPAPPLAKDRRQGYKPLNTQNSPSKKAAKAEQKETKKRSIFGHFSQKALSNQSNAEQTL